MLAPIDGTVVDRLVDVGQTVNAGTSAPSLYLLAGDLARIRISPPSAGADIGQLARPARYVHGQATGCTFDGTVRQVRLQSTTTDSVVTYTAVVDVDNTDRALLPGMTASVSFVVAEASEREGVRRGHGSPRHRRPPRQGDAVYIVGSGRRARARPRRVGLSDGSTTEVRSGLPGRAAGRDRAVRQRPRAAASSSPFQSSRSSSGGRPPGGPLCPKGARWAPPSVVRLPRRHPRLRQRRGRGPRAPSTST
ncbi:MAG: HlyD family efflux transporter periplasmic adaptor subunit [Myxococcota bacterium]